MPPYLTTFFTLRNYMKLTSLLIKNIKKHDILFIKTWQPYNRVKMHVKSTQLSNLLRLGITPTLAATQVKPSPGVRSPRLFYKSKSRRLLKKLRRLNIMPNLKPTRGALTLLRVLRKRIRRQRLFRKPRLITIPKVMRGLFNKYLNCLVAKHSGFKRGRASLNCGANWQKKFRLNHLALKSYAAVANISYLVMPKQGITVGRVSGLYSFLRFYHQLVFYPYMFIKALSAGGFKKTTQLGANYARSYDGRGSTVSKKDIYLNYLLINFIEALCSKKVYINILKNQLNSLKSAHKLILLLWSLKLNRFFFRFDKQVKINFFLTLVYIALSSKDLTLLMNILEHYLLRLKFWQHRGFFIFFTYILKYYFIDIFPELGLKGVQFEVKGKISVGGNSRKRKILIKILQAAKANYSLKTKYQFRSVKTLAGALGLKLWLYY